VFRDTTTLHQQFRNLLSSKFDIPSKYKSYLVYTENIVAFPRKHHIGTETIIAVPDLDDVNHLNHNTIEHTENNRPIPTPDIAKSFALSVFKTEERIVRFFNAKVDLNNIEGLVAVPETFMWYFFSVQDLAT